jgi:hypothetical protein
MASPIEKGNQLEASVRAIETAILKSSPALRENTFTIESKKIVVVDGVRHEIDVYVQVEMGAGYKAIFIFECKNWEAVVGKNEIIIFSEKIDAVQAQKGFFVAKSFSKDALAQAKKDSRIELLIATEHDAAETPVPFEFHSIIFERDKAVSQIEMLERGVSASAPKMSIDISTATAIFRGTPIELQNFINEWIEQVANDNLNQFPSGKMADGTYERTAEAERTFEVGELLVNEMDMARATLQTQFPVRVVRPPIISHYEVATRGRTLSFAPLQIGDATLQYGLTLHVRA